MTDMDTQQDGFTRNKVKNRNDKRRRRGNRVPISFASDVHGMNIRNAATGSFYDERVGTLDERKFFKVVGKSTFKMNLRASCLMKDTICHRSTTTLQSNMSSTRM